MFGFGSNESANPVTASSRAMPSARLSADVAEKTAHQDLPVRLHHDRIDITGANRVRVPRIGQSGHGVEPGDFVAPLSADGVENAARQNLPIRLHRDRIDHDFAKSGSNESAKPVVASSRAMELRDSLRRCCRNCRRLRTLPSASTAIESTSPLAFGSHESASSGRGVEPGDAVARLSSDAGEKAAHQNLSVRLKRDGIDTSRSHPGQKPCRACRLHSGAQCCCVPRPRRC